MECKSQKVEVKIDFCIKLNLTEIKNEKIIVQKAKVNCKNIKNT